LDLQQSWKRVLVATLHLTHTCCANGNAAECRGLGKIEKFSTQIPKLAKTQLLTKNLGKPKQIFSMIRLQLC